MILADTDVLIDFLNGKGPAAERIAFELGQDALRTTVISRFELLSGARTPSQQEKWLTLFTAIPALPLDPAAADLAAQVRRELESQGAAIGMGDSLIAGIVLRHSAVLLTRNRRHFERVRGLILAEV